MEEPNGVAICTAEVRSVFKITGRGTALILEDGFTGTIEGPGIIQGKRGTSLFAGPEFATGRDASGKRKSWLAIIAKADNATDLFRPGETVTFFRKSF